MLTVLGQNTHEIIITEIFADPTPSNGLPEREYLEIYNNSSKSIETSDFLFIYQNSVVRLPKYKFQPNTYLILTRIGNAQLFSNYGPVLELSQFSLLNNGAVLKLVDGVGRVSHQVSYTRNWYEAGKEEGFSLEMIDLSFPCVGMANWTSSQAAIGGTPGMVNSVNGSKPDITPPSISSFEISGRVLSIIFNESLSEISLRNFDFLITTPFVAIDSIKTNSDYSQLSIFISEELKDNEDYLFALEGIQDCSGNVANELRITISNRPSPSPNDILISEILFDPFPGGEDFVEIKNISRKSLDLSELRLYNKDGEGELRSEVILNKVTNEKLILEPDSVFCFTRNKDFLQNNFEFARDDRIIELSSLPSMPNESGELVIRNKKGEILDEINYSSSWHYESIDDPEGVSLERISFEKPSDVRENWQSTSGTYGFATPGFIPSRNIAQEWIQVSPELISPDNDGFEEELLITFSGIRTSKSATITVFDRYGGQVEKIASNLYVNEGSTILWNGQPKNGTRLPSGYYYLFVQLTDSKEVYTSKIPFVIAYRN